MCESLLGCILILINIVFLIVGLAVMAAGAFLQWGQNFIATLLSPSLTAAASGTGAAGDTSTSLTIEMINDLMGQYMSVLGSAGLIIFICGAVLACISVSGLCGICYKSKILLVVYVISLIVIFLALGIIVLVYIFKKNDLYAFISQQLQLTINTQYTGISNLNGASGIITVAQARLECCGVKNSSDFLTATQWNRTYVVDYNGNKKVIQLEIPVSCCKVKPNTFEPVDVNCTFSPTTENSNYNVGCFDKLWHLIIMFGTFAIYGMGGLCGFLLILIITAIVLIRSYSKEAVTPI